MQPERLSAVRGIGPWTSEMFLLFQLRRLDVWPVGDLGVRRGYGLAWQVPTPTARELTPLGEPFRPYRSVAAWYCWRAAELYADAAESALTRLGRSFEGHDGGMQKFSLEATARELLERARGGSGGRAATTVIGGHEKVLRQTVIAMVDGATLAEHENSGEASVHVLAGRVRLTAGQHSWEGRRGDLLMVPAASHSLAALEDSAVLLTVAKLARCRGRGPSTSSWISRSLMRALAIHDHQSREAVAGDASAWVGRRAAGAASSRSAGNA